MAINNNKILVEYVNKLNVPLCIIDEDKIITYLNKYMIKLFGNLLGESEDIIFADCMTVSDSKQGASTSDSHHAYIYKGEALYDIISNNVTTEDNMEYTIKLFIDITEQKKMEAQLTNSYNKLLKETMFAKRVQHSVLPIDDTCGQIIDFKGEYLPADELSGDMYDIIKLDNEEFLFYMADVSGHGIRSALLTIFLREVVRGLSHIAQSQGLDSLLNVLHKNYAELDIDPEMYFSILMCKYNHKTNELNLVNAGHNCFPLILRSKGRIEEIPLKGMPITIINPITDYVEESTGLYPGDRVILYTDGIAEEYSEITDREFGVQGVRNVVDMNFNLKGHDLCRRIVEEGEKHSKVRAKDDRSIMVVSIL
jgi:sigma-B regulation protein RsbU (phosphoserine phosphatase)